MQEQVFREFLISKRTKLSQFVRKGIGSLRDAQYDAAQEWASVGLCCTNLSLKAYSTI